jgi:hypothetical protein
MEDAHHLNSIVSSNMTLGEKQDKVKEMNDNNVKETVHNILGNLADHEESVKKEENKVGVVQKENNVDADTVDEYINL